MLPDWVCSLFWLLLELELVRLDSRRSELLSAPVSEPEEELKSWSDAFWSASVMLPDWLPSGERLQSEQPKFALNGMANNRIIAISNSNFASPTGSKTIITYINTWEGDARGKSDAWRAREPETQRKAGTGN